MQPKRLPVLACALAGSLLAGCASIVSDNESATYIETVPEVARCELHGQDFTRVVTTPASVQLPAEAAPVTLACKADGYANTTQTVDTHMDGWIFGNILFGGLVGVAIDAARGAGQKYPPRVTVVLEPARFDTAAARDAWYGERRAVIEAKWDKAIAGARSRCTGPSGPSDPCHDDLKALERKKTEELEALDEKWQKAVVVSQ